MTTLDEVDLPVDLNTMDESGLPWSYLDEASRPELIVQGRHLIVGSGQVRAVAEVIDITTDGIVHVRPLRGPVSRHVHLLEQTH